MPSVTIERTIAGSTAAEVFEQVKEIEQLPEMSESVLRVDLRTESDGTVVSDWEVMFRGGVMKWTEADYFDEANLKFEFRQLEGDLASFEGYWQVEAGAGDEVLLTLYVEFDLGMPSLADMLDPVATRALELAFDEVLEALIAQRDTDSAQVRTA